MEFDTWREAMSQAFLSLEIEAPRKDEFSGHIATSSLGALSFATLGGAAARVRRSAAAIRRADHGSLKVGVQTRGRCALVYNGREAVLSPGDFAIYDTSRPYQLAADEHFEMLVLMLPRELLLNRTRTLPDITGRRIAGDQGLGAVLSPFLVQLGNRLLAGDLEPTMEVCDAVVDLLAAVYRVSSDDTLVVPDSAQGALLLRAKAHIDERLGDPALDPVGVAAAHHVSVRYLQKLFQAEGTTPARWIRSRRLQQCLRELRDDRRRDVPVAAIGARWGFGERANFARAFRREFGVPPSAVRPDATRRPAVISIASSDSQH